jgi:hypothetical protein
MRQWARLRSGLADLIIDARTRTVALPIGGGRKERVTLPFDEIQGITVRLQPAVIRTTKRGWTVTTSNRKTGSYYLALVDRNESPTKVVTSSNEQLLRGIAETPSQTFGWPLR